MEVTTPDATAEKPKEIYDVDAEKWIPNPDLVEKKADAEDEKKPVAAKEQPKKKAEPEPEEEEEEEEGAEVEVEDKQPEPEEEEEEEEGAEVEVEDKPKAKKEEESTPDKYVEKAFGEKYGIKTEADLFKILEHGMDANDEVKSLKEEITKVKADAGKPKFKTPAHESAFDFVSQFDPKMQGEALQTFAKLIGMNLDDADPTMLLEEKFIHENSQWTRAESQRMFKKEYQKKYDLVREKFEGTDAEFEEEKKDVDIMRKGDIAKARTYLKDLKEKHKPSSEEEQPKTNEAVTKAVEKNAKDYTTAITKVTELAFEEDGHKYVFKLDDDKKKQVQLGVDAWVKNPANYNEKGELIGAGTPDEMINTIIGGMFMKDIINSMLSQMKNQVNIKRVEDVANKLPKKRKAPGSGETSQEEDLDAQAVMIIKKRKAA